MTGEQLGWATCGLCGQGGPDTEILGRPTVWTTEAAQAMGKGTKTFDYIDRCRDERACRARVELGLEVPWPLDDATPAPERPAAPAENPLPELESVPADAGMGGRSSAIAAGVGPQGSLVPGESGSNVSAPSLEEDIEWLR